MSEGQSTDSGISEDGAIRPRTVGSTRDDAKRLNAIDAATATCSMCDEAASTFLCTQCGRLSFCTDCCVSLHDNKFLSSHKLIALDPANEGEPMSLQDVKAVTMKAVPQPPTTFLPTAVASNGPLSAVRSAQSEDGSERAATARQNSTAAAVEEEQEALDLPMLAADRNIITARLNEISACRTLLADVGTALSNERFSCKDVSRTAIEAVRKKFDVLRNLISEKEAEFVGVIEKAARQRLESATKLSLEASVSLAECDAFVEQTKNQLERTSLNKKLFADARSSMMQAAEERLRGTDDTIQRLQQELDRLTSISLGVHIELDGCYAAVNALRPPSETTRRVEDAPRVLPIPVHQFLNTPGVKVHKQAAELPPNPRASTPTRQSFQQQIHTLQSTPPREVLDPKKLMNTTMAAGAAPLPSSSSLPAPHHEIGKIAQKFRQNGSGARAAGAYPAELEKLRQQVASSAAAERRRPSTASATQSSAAARGRSPLPQRNTPQRGSSPAGGVALPRGGSPARSAMEYTPGPGAYYQSRDFNARSILSTPPRRR